MDFKVSKSAESTPRTHARVSPLLRFQAPREASCAADAAADADEDAFALPTAATSRATAHGAAAAVPKLQLSRVTHGAWRQELIGAALLSARSRQQPSPPQSSRSPSSLPPSSYLPTAALALAPGSARLAPAVRARVAGVLRRRDTRRWAEARARPLAPPRLHPAVLRTVSEWFRLVDDDGSGTLEHHELSAALRAARVPADAASIHSMIRLISDRDGRIAWADFERFMVREFADGKQLMSGEYVLATGQSLPFGAMVSRLKRARMLRDVAAGGEARARLARVAAGGIARDSAAVAAAEEEIRRRRARNESLILGPAAGAPTAPTAAGAATARAAVAAGSTAAAAGTTATAADPRPSPHTPHAPTTAAAIPLLLPVSARCLNTPVSARAVPLGRLLAPSAASITPRRRA